MTHPFIHYLKDGWLAAAAAATATAGIMMIHFFGIDQNVESGWMAVVFWLRCAGHVSWSLLRHYRHLEFIEVKTLVEGCSS